MASTPPRVAQLAQALRFDSLFWRKLANLGSVYGPEWWKRYSPPVFASIIFALVGRNRRGAIANMRHVLGDDGSGRATLLALKMFAEFSHCMTETMEYFGPRPKPVRLDVPEEDPTVTALQQGRGAIVVTGHFGNWDITARLMRTYGRPVNVVMAHEAHPAANEYVRKMREQAGVRVIYSDTSVFSSLTLLSALRRNEVVALQLDRLPPGAGYRMIPFFGSPVPFPSGPFDLARLSTAPIIPAFGPRLGVRHYAVRMGGSFTVPRSARGKALELPMLEVVKTFEAVIRERPTQWFQFAPFWQASPPAARAESDGPRAGDPIDRRGAVGAQSSVVS